MRGAWAAILVAMVLPLSACSSSSSTPGAVAIPGVARHDVTVGATPAIQVCGSTTGPSPEIPPQFATDAPSTGDLVRPGAVVVAVCPISSVEATGYHHPLVEIGGRSLDTLITAINASSPYPPHAACPANAGWSRLLLFSYADGRRLAVRLDASGCGLVDNGAQQRLGSWVGSWGQRLDRATAARD